MCFAIWSARSCWTMAINIARCSVCPQVNTGDLIFLILTIVLSLLFLCPEKGGKGIYIKKRSSFIVAVSDLRKYKKCSTYSSTWITHTISIRWKYSQHFVGFSLRVSLLIAFFSICEYRVIFFYVIQCTYHMRLEGVVSCFFVVVFLTSVPCSRIDLYFYFSFS